MFDGKDVTNYTPEKMAKLGSGSSPEFLSTHPSDSSRIANLQAQLPKVLPLYQATKTKGKTKAKSSESTGKYIKAFGKIKDQRKSNRFLESCKRNHFLPGAVQ